MNRARFRGWETALWALLALVAVAPARARADVAPEASGALAARNTLYLEIVGSAPVLSLSYERSLGEHVIFRGGLGYLRATTFLGTSLDRVQVPLLAGYLVGSGSHRLELGAGVVPGVLLNPRGPLIETPAALVVGYRYRPPAGGFNFRVGVTPLLDFWNANWRGTPVIPLLGLSFGYGF